MSGGTRVTPRTDVRPGEDLGDHAQAQVRSVFDAPGITATAVRNEVGSGSPIGGVISHYRFEELLGAGGMGVVYRATDLTLGRAVAIKLLSKQLATDETAKARFVREARAASALDHPNIATVYEIGEHQGELFIAMALYQGKTLKQRLENGSPQLLEAIDVLQQLAQGLAAAHAAGIVHRDIKPANVMLTDTGTVKLLDFGLAKRLADSAGETATQAGQAPGTLQYMSPEQLKGEAVHQRTDLWSLGVVAYEMLAGVSPFRASSNAAIAARILNEEPPSLASVPGVPDWCANLISQLLHKDPAKRLASASEFIRRLEQQSPNVKASIKPKSYLRVLWTALALLIAAGVGIWMQHSWTPAHKAAISTTAGQRSRRAVAVLGFNDLSQRPESAWLSTALSEMLTSELGVGEHLLVVSGESVAQIKRNLNLAPGSTYGPDTLQRIRKLIGADLVVFGSYLLTPDKKLRLDLRMQEASEGKTHVLSDSGTESDLFGLVSRVGGGLRSQLGVAVPSEKEAQVVRSSLPSNSEARRLYSEGLSKLRSFDALAARFLLERAIQIDSEHPLAHSALASAWSLLGYDAKAKEEAKKAFELSTNLSREDKYSVEARYRSMNNEWKSAAEIYRKLFDFFPDNLEYGLRLAESQVASGKGNEGLATLELLRKLPASTRQDPRIDLAEARAARSVSDFRRQQAAASRASSRGSELGAPLLTVLGLLDEGRAFIDLGEYPKAIAAYQKAKEMASALGDDGQLASAYYGLGIVGKFQGDSTVAKAMFEESLAIWTRLGNRKGIGDALMWIGNLLRIRGDLTKAKKVLEESLAIRREIGHQKGVADSLGNIGLVLMNQGDIKGAISRYQESNAVFREIGDKFGEAIGLGNTELLLLFNGDLTAARRTSERVVAIFGEVGSKANLSRGLSNLALVLAAEGDLRAARQNCEQALTLATGNKNLKSEILSTLGEILRSQGNLGEARKAHEEALAIKRELGGGGGMAESHLYLSALLLDEDKFLEAEKLALQASEELRQQRSFGLPVAVEDILGRSLLAQGRILEAQKAVARALAVSPADHGERISAEITDARVRAMSNPKAAGGAQRALERLIIRAAKEGFVARELEARLALGEIQLKYVDTLTGHQQLRQVEKDAKARGFMLIAGKAAAARGKAHARVQ